MNGYYVIDDFLDDFDRFDAYARELEYKTIVSPIDGVGYPDMAMEIPVEVQREIIRKIQAWVGFTIVPHMMFLRLTSKSTAGAPHQAHNDAIMGKFSLMLYMQDGEGGTSFVEHIEGTGIDAEVWARDTNVPEAWKVNDLIRMKRNRATIFPADYMHRAEPVGGFGEDASNGRLVLTVFFS